MPESSTLLVPTLWLGILIGISFIATPVKFRVPGLTRAVALEIGRATFRLFSRIEWLLTALVIAVDAAAKSAAWRWPPTALLAAIVVAQSFWLLPMLERRVASIVGGRRLAPSHAHWT
ncbi:MAG: DUF4149 domain-containing protein [Stellaceae bacterium]